MAARRQILPLTEHGKGKRVPAKSGLNWGHAPSRNNIDEGCILVPTSVDRTGFFPPRKKKFKVTTDDGETFYLHRTGQRGKSLHGVENLELLGKYFRKRLGVPLGQPVTIHHLRRYGRLDVAFYRKRNSYLLDFSSSTKFAEDVAVVARQQRATSIPVLKQSGQGYLADAKRRKIVEDYAMVVARRQLERRKFKNIRDVSQQKKWGCDYLANLDGQQYFIEVKGSSGDGSSVILTKNEVKTSEKNPGRSALIVVPSVRINDDLATQEVETVAFIAPWSIEKSDLEATEYRYTVPKSKTKTLKRKKRR